ncbi:MAG: magnesium transporter MgtE N-terminal domain-containing protein, partial [Acidimicrobiales bacterium]
MQLSVLLGRPLATPSGDRVGRVDDVIVRLRGGDYPLVIGLVAKLGGRRLFLGVDKLVRLDDDPVVLRKPRVDPREFERREGEVLLRQDILGHRLIDVADVELVRAWDVEIEHKDEGWVLSCVDTRRPTRLRGLLRRPAVEAGVGQDWLAFEPLIGHASSADSRRSFG